MYPVRARWNWVALLTVLLTASMAASAIQVTGNVGVDLRYTDNATLAPANEKDDIITTTSINASVTENQGPVTGSASASVNYLDYLDNTFGKQTYLQLDTTARWAQISNVLSWDFTDVYSQAKVDNLAASIPSNTEDINVANLSANLALRPADRHTVTITPSFSDYYYETTGNDNQQTSITGAWSYRFRPTVNLSLTGSYREISYNDSMLGSDYTSSNVSIGVRVLRSRSSYAALVGTSKASQDSGPETKGMIANLAANYKLSSRSTINANVSTNITDTSDIYLTSAQNPNTGNFGNVQTSSAVVRNSVARIAYIRGGAPANFSAWVELRKLEYETLTISDRQIQEYGASASYSLAPKLSASIRGSYVETDEQSLMLTDRYYLADGKLGYTMSRKLNAQAGVRFQKRDSDNPLSVYDEYSVFAGLAYRLGR